MAESMLYEDRVSSLTDRVLQLRGATRFLGRPVRLDVAALAGFRLRSKLEYPGERLPARGITDDGVWFTRDSRRWRRKWAVEVVLRSGSAYGFSPAHPTRMAEMLERAGLDRLS